MKKFFNKKTNKEVVINGPIKTTFVDHNGYTTEIEADRLTPTLLAYLMDAGAVVAKEVEEPKTPNVPNDLSYYVQRFGNKLGWSYEESADFLLTVTKAYPAATLAILLKEIAIVLDKKYKDHISNCTEVYVFSLTEGRISCIPARAIKSFKHFAAFRTLEDARFACSLLRGIIKPMYETSKK